MTPYYADDAVTLHHGDMESVLASFEDGTAFDCAVTDPPYGETSLAWDRWPEGWPGLVADVTSSMWCFGSMRMFLDQRDEFADWRLSQDVVWHKNITGFNAGDRFSRVHEHALHWYRGAWSDTYHQPDRVPAKRRQIGDQIPRRPKKAGTHGLLGPSHQVSDGLAYVESIQRAGASPSRGASSIHQTQKPVELLDRLIRYACPPGGTVLDPFAGSGSTGEAARASGRRAVLIEGEESYCEAIARRLSQGDLFGGAA